MKIQAIIEILSYWHAGTGLGLGVLADAITLKDENHLPYLPGKTLKGLFREAFQILEDSENIPSNTTTKYFGEATTPDNEIINAESGCCFFTNANISKELKNYLLSDTNQRDCLYETISSTKLDDKGMAEDKSLRTIEVCMPVTLSGIIETQDNTSLDYFQKAAGLIRSLGSHRHRGLGRCKVTVKLIESK